MRNEDVTWAELVAEGLASGDFKDTAELADAMGINATTTWRWVSQGRRPGTVEVVEKFAAVTGLDPDRSLRIAGFAPRGKAAEELPAVPKGFNHSDPIVRGILAADVDEDTRAEMFEHYRRRLDEAKRDLDWMQRHARRDDGDEPKPKRGAA